MSSLAEVGTITVDQSGRSLWIVELGGEHDLSTVGDLHTRLDAIFAQGTTLVIDLSQATFIDSSIINELVAAQRRADGDPNERLAVVAPPGGTPARVLKLMNVGHILSIFETREDALRSVDEL